MNIVIKAELIHKSYGKTVAIDGVSFEIRKGECFGFVGPNGAGKTTLMKAIYASAGIDSGNLFLFGKNIAEDPYFIKSRLGVLPQEEGLDRDLTVLQNLTHYAAFYNIPSKKRRQTAIDLLKYVELDQRGKSSPDKLSSGMKRRLLLARSLINDPEILILDEPTIGLDPQSRHLVWDKVLNMKDSGKTIILTTHYMEEASYLCDRVAIMNEGKIIALDSPGNLIEKYVGREIIEIKRSSNENINDITDKLPKDITTKIFGERIYIHLREINQVDLSKDIFKGRELVFRKASLEDVFLHLTGYELRKES